jgi:hypothetical protein
MSRAEVEDYCHREPKGRCGQKHDCRIASCRIRYQGI